MDKPTTLDRSSVQDDFLRQGYILVDHRIPSEAIEDVIGAYADFTDNIPDPSLQLLDRMMPAANAGGKINLDIIDHSQDNQREWHKYRTNHWRPRKPGGYTNRSLQVAALAAERGLIIKDDPKEYWHSHTNNIQKINEQRERYGWGPMPPEVEILEQQFAVIHHLARVAMTRVYIQLATTHPDLVRFYGGPSNLVDSPLRLLFYHHGQGPMLAEKHYDQSYATQQIAESHQGFQILNPQTQEMVDVVRPPEKGVVFISAAWKKHAYPDSPLMPALHQVVNTPEANEGRRLQGRNCARWALIHFADADARGLVRPSKEETHTINPAWHNGNSQSTRV